MISAGLLLGAASLAHGQVAIWHDPWLNWNLINLTGLNANDIDLIVDNPNYNPNVNDPSQVMAGLFPLVTVTHADYDGNGDVDTRIRWSGAQVNPLQVIHIGLYMKDSGKVLDGYWTMNGAKVGASAVFTYEKTEIRYVDPEVHMHLNMNPGWFRDNPSHEAGWTNIRTFVNLPASLLDLKDLNESLNLDSLSAYEVQPKRGDNGLPIQRTDVITADGPDSFFDVFLSAIPPEMAGPQYEALLVAEVLNQPNPGGWFWNLNPQCPEPLTASLLTVASVALLRRRR
jgi:hypothetical protein